MPYIMTLVSLFAADSAMKSWIEKTDTVSESQESTVLQGVAFKRYHNRGAMMNIGEERQQLVAALSFVFSAIVTGIFAVTLGMKGKRLLKTALALILGGAYSNTYDRLRRKYVVDYITFPKISTMVFNLSDFGIMIGAMLLTISELSGGQD
ncbi:signal peptidase II [Lachnospiraceae bacterium A4]|nr:signal peptidase II [Lachnospiraceae bacterium A4]